MSFLSDSIQAYAAFGRLWMEGDQKKEGVRRHLQASSRLQANGSPAVPGGESMLKTTELKVRDLLSEPYAVRPGISIKDAIELMRKERVDFLSITDEHNTLVGVLTENDLIKIIRPESPSVLASATWIDHVKKDRAGAPIREIMHTKYASISPDESLQSALRIMHANNYKMLHVVDGKHKLLGLIRIRDVFRMLVHEAEKAAK